jgi:hypothetical protein
MHPRPSNFTVYGTSIVVLFHVANCHNHDRKISGNLRVWRERDFLPEVFELKKKFWTFFTVGNWSNDGYMTSYISSTRQSPTSVNAGVTFSVALQSTPVWLCVGGGST